MNLSFRIERRPSERNGNPRITRRAAFVVALGAAMLGAIPRMAEAVTVPLTFVADRTSSWHSFAVDSVTGKVYVRNNYVTGVAVTVYNDLAAFQSGSSSGSISLQDGGYWGTYIAVVNGILYGRGSTASDAFVAAWDLATGNRIQGPTVVPGMGGSNGIDTFDWGGFSAVNLAQDQSGLYVMGAIGAGWYVQQIDSALGVVASTYVGPKSQGYGFVINGFYFSSTAYNSNSVDQRYDLGTGAATSVSFTLSGPSPYVYWHNASYDPGTDTLYLSSGTSPGRGVWKLEDASVVFGVDNVCGDGTVGSGEACDDGNITAGDCCDASCQYEAEGSPCTTDDDVCTDDTCDAAGSCEHSNNTAPCDDGAFCTVGDTCTGGSCIGSARDCADADACTPDSCDETGDACVHVETARDASSCYVALKTRLQITDSSTAGKDKLSWQWGGGEAFDQAALGTPQDATTYTLCVYDAAAAVSSLKASIDIAASDTLWTSKDPKGLLYKDKAGTSEGVTKAQLKTGADGKTKVKLSATGTNLVLPPPAGSMFFAQDPSVVVQLVNSAGSCWTSEFLPASTTSNTAESFKAQVK